MTDPLPDIDALLALAYNAPLAPRDLPQHVSALERCLRPLRDDLHGATLAKILKQRIAEIIDALRALAQSGPQFASEEYLVRTAVLHDLITNARGPAGLPKSNRDAVHRSWKSDGESLDDGLKEIARLIKDAQNPDGDDVDDGWDEIGLGRAGIELDEVEIARAKNVHNVLRLTTLLHKRISLDLLPYPSDAPVSTFDTLLTLSNQLLSTSDDLVASVYAPQEAPYIRQEILHVSEIATSLQSHLALLLPAPAQLSERLQALTIDASTKKRADKKWFDTCVDQIIGLCASVS